MDICFRHEHNTIFLILATFVLCQHVNQMRYSLFHLRDRTGAIDIFHYLHKPFSSVQDFTALLNHFRKIIFDINRTESHILFHIFKRFFKFTFYPLKVLKFCTGQNFFKVNGEHITFFFHKSAFFYQEIRAFCNKKLVIQLLPHDLILCFQLRHVAALRTHNDKNFRLEVIS